MRIPTGIEPLVGVRVWSLTPSPHRREFGGNYLMTRDSRPSRVFSMVADDSNIWKNAKGNIAKCVRVPGTNYNYDPHEVTDDNCSCGIYARKPGEWDASWQEFRPDSCIEPTRAPYSVMGEVLLSGNILEGTRGYRAEKADIKCFYKMPGFYTGPLESVADAYEVPLADTPDWYYTCNFKSEQEDSWSALFKLIDDARQDHNRYITAKKEWEQSIKNSIWHTNHDNQHKHITFTKERD